MFTIAENTISTTPSTTVTDSADIRVVFYDGEREIDLGKVQVLSTMTFKMFQTLLSSKIGISPHQITIYFERYNQNNNNHHRRRHPVTNKFDFRALVADPGVDGCFFWVVLKRARRNRRRRNNNTITTTTNNFKNDHPVGDANDGFVLLRRDVNDWVYFDHLNRVRMITELERQRENYLMSLNLNSNVYTELSGLNLNNHHNNNNYQYGDDYYDLNGNSVLSMSSDDHDYYDRASCSTGGTSSERAFCDVCYSFSGCGESAPFHWCKNDVVTMGFRSSPAGPIVPPSKANLFD